MNKRGILTVVSGFSGSGKGTVLKLLKNKYPNYKISISCTTRDMRENESDGVDYFYKTDKEFERMIENGDFLEYAGFVGNYYGTPKTMVNKWLDDGFDVILEIEVNGAMQVMQNMPEATFIFILPPSANELRRRLTGRGRENADEINNRIRRACEEIKFIDKYQYIVVNGIAKECSENINDIINAVKDGSVIAKYLSDTSKNKKLTDKLTSELNEYC